MNTKSITQLSAIILFFAATSVAVLAADKSQYDDSFNKDFIVDKGDLSSTGSSPYFVLEPGFASVFEGKEKGETTLLTITVTNETKTVDGVKTRIVEEKETADGELVEISHNYFAISQKTGDIYYFGEDTDVYKHGQKSHGSDSWHSGVNGAHFGLGLPAHPEKGMKYYQEVAPGVAMDRAEIIGLGEVVKTPAGEFSQCIKTEETTPLEGGKEYKYYAPKVGMIQEGSLKLIKYGQGN